MPLSYGDVGQSTSQHFLRRRGSDLVATAHNHVRTAAGLFDVSHMLQHHFTGPSAQAFLMSLCPSSLDALAPYTSTLSVFLNETGGIIDDTIITKHADGAFYVVTNAGRSAEDCAMFEAALSKWNAEHSGQEVKWEQLEGWGLLALQGPKAAAVLQSLTETDLSQVKFGQSTYAEIGAGKVKCHVARGGYTGEDGFEVRFMTTTERASG